MVFHVKHPHISIYPQTIKFYIFSLFYYKFQIAKFSYLFSIYVLLSKPLKSEVEQYLLFR